LYADDIALIARSTAELQRLLAAAEAHSLSNGYRFNVGKCQVIETPESEQVSLYGRALPSGESFRYLGVQVGKKGIKDADQYEMLKRAGLRALSSLGGLLNRKDLSALLKLAAYKTFIRPTMEYGMALLKPTKRHLEALEKIQAAASRMILWVPKSASRLVMEGLLALEPITRRQKLLCANYWAQLSTKDSTFLAKAAQGSKLYRRIAAAQEPLLATIAGLKGEAKRNALRTAHLFDWIERVGRSTQSWASRINRLEWRPDPILSLDSTVDRLALTRWRTGTAIIPRGPCALCQSPDLSWRHAIACSGASHLLRQSATSDAEEPISVVLNGLESLPRPERDLLTHSLAGAVRCMQRCCT
jgi:hypothetical protein